MMCPVRLSRLKRVFLGSPLPTAQSRHERLAKSTALAVFASDALSSVAYATEEILLVLVLAGTVALSYSIPISVAIAVLIAIVVSSYRQTIRAYPQGGGAYIVSKDNLGVPAGLVAGAALLIDYVLTVAVSVAAGIAALTSAVPVLFPYRPWLCVAAVVAIAVANLRGIRESGNLFAAPTYLFIGSFFVSWIAIAWTTFTAGLIAMTQMTVRFMFPNVLAEPPSTMKIGLPSNFDPDAVSERFKAEWGFWVVRSTRYNGQDIIYALQSVCTHLGCPPNWLPNERWLLVPACVASSIVWSKFESKLRSRLSSTPT